MPAPPSGVPGSLEEAGVKVGEDIISTHSLDQDDSLHWCPPQTCSGAREWSRCWEAKPQAAEKPGGWRRA